jgi:hypothetical protein
VIATTSVLDLLGVPSGVVHNGTRNGTLPAVLRAIGACCGAEVGVERGHFSAHLCQSMPGLQLLAVDAWLAYPGYREHVTQAKLDGFYTEACARLAPFNVQVRRGLSVAEAARVVDGSLDFVYLDSNHTLSYVIADLAAWTPKVRKGGIIAGHDFGRGSVGHVQEAVTAWTSAYRIDPWFVLAGDRSPSFLWVQP